MSNEQQTAPSKAAPGDTTQRTGEQKPNYMKPEAPNVRPDSPSPNQTQPKKDPGTSGTPEPKKV